MISSSQSLINIPFEPVTRSFTPASPSSASPGPGYVVDHIVELQIFTTLYCRMRDSVPLKQARLDFTFIANALNQPWNLQWLTPEQNREKSEYIRRCMARISRPAAWPAVPSFARSAASGTAYGKVKNPKAVAKLIAEGAPSEFLKGPNKNEYMQQVAAVCSGLYDAMRA